jgi:hypothetical protein
MQRADEKKVGSTKAKVENVDGETSRRHRLIVIRRGTSKEQGARSKEQGARSAEQGARSKERGAVAFRNKITLPLVHPECSLNVDYAPC